MHPPLSVYYLAKNKITNEFIGQYSSGNCNLIGRVSCYGYTLVSRSQTIPKREGSGDKPIFKHVILLYHNYS